MVGKQLVSLLVSQPLVSRVLDREILLLLLLLFHFLKMGSCGSLLDIHEEQFENAYIVLYWQIILSVGLYQRLF